MLINIENTFLLKRLEAEASREIRGLINLGNDVNIIPGLEHSVHNCHNKNNIINMFNNDIARRKEKERENKYLSLVTCAGSYYPPLSEDQSESWEIGLIEI